MKTSTPNLSPNTAADDEAAAIAQEIARCAIPRCVNLGGYDATEMLSPVEPGEVRAGADGRQYVSFNGGRSWCLAPEIISSDDEPSASGFIFSDFRLVHDDEGRPLGVDGEGPLYLARVTDAQGAESVFCSAVRTGWLADGAASWEVSGE